MAASLTACGRASSGSNRTGRRLDARRIRGDRINPDIDGERLSRRDMGRTTSPAAANRRDGSGVPDGDAQCGLVVHHGVRREAAPAVEGGPRRASLTGVRCEE